MNLKCAILLVLAASSSACGPASTNSDTSNESGKPEYLQPLASLDNLVIPKNSLGSSYKEMMEFIVAHSKKDEFETTENYNKRIKNLPRTIDQKFGKKFVFEVTDDMIYDSDTGFLKFDQSDFILGLKENGDVINFYSISLENCKKDLNLKMAPESAKIAKDQTRVRYFFTGEFLLSNGTDRKANGGMHGTIPNLSGFRVSFNSVNAKTYINVYMDFKIKEFLIMDRNSGKILNRKKCEN